jgi:Domain of unknown function (DUF6916)
MNLVPIANLTHKDFADNLNTDFIVDLGKADTLPLRLTKAQAGPPSARIEQFALEFSSSQPPRFTQGVFLVTHPAIGTFEIFITCLGPDGPGSKYEAIFNRLIDRQS